MSHSLISKFQVSNPLTQTYLRRSFRKYPSKKLVGKSVSSIGDAYSSNTNTTQEVTLWPYDLQKLYCYKSSTTTTTYLEPNPLTIPSSKVHPRGQDCTLPKKVTKNLIELHHVLHCSSSHQIRNCSAPKLNKPITNLTNRHVNEH